jgi:chromosome partitioning protein
MSQIIAVTNQKGGVGKTTSSVNVAASLAYQGYKTLVIDFDPQGHSSEHLGLRQFENKQDPHTILQVLKKEKTLPACVIPSRIPNLWALTADLSLGQFNQMSPTGNQFLLKEAINLDIRNKYDFIIIDCQPSLSLLTLNALTCSNRVLLPVQAEFLALDGLSQLILTLHEVQTKLHPQLRVLGIFLTMFDARNKLSGEVLAELQKNFKDDLFTTVIPRNVKLAEAPSFGKSIFEYDPGSQGAQAYHRLTQEIINRIATGK